MTSSDLGDRLAAGEGDVLLSPAKLRRDPTLRGQLFALDAFPAGCTEPALGHAVLCELDLLAIGAGSPGLEPHLAECAACAAEEADAKASLDELEAPTSAPQVGLRCVYCHDGLEVAAAAYCASCLAVHHPDCFQEHGACAAPGCGERRWVRSSAPQAVAAPRRNLGLLRLAAGVLATALLGGGLYLKYEATLRDEERRAAARARAVLAERQKSQRRVAELEAELQLLIAKQKYEEARAMVETTVPLLGGVTLIDEHEGLRRLVQILEVVKSDSAAYQEALEIIRSRAVTRYPEAWDHLHQIDPRSRSVYPDAKAYLAWLEGEQRVAAAHDRLARGEVSAAEGILQSALQSYRSVDLAQVTSETASTLRDSIKKHDAVSGRWTAGADAFARAEADIRDDHLERARLDLLLAVEYLPPESPQAKSAQAYLKQLQRLAENKDERLLFQRRRDGFELTVKRQDWRTADAWARQLLEHHQIEPEWIMSRVRAYEAKEKLFAEGERVLREGLEKRYVWARDLFSFLEAWLPPGDPRRQTCAAHVQELERRLAVPEPAPRARDR